MAEAGRKSPGKLEECKVRLYRRIAGGCAALDLPAIGDVDSARPMRDMASQAARSEPEPAGRLPPEGIPVLVEFDGTGPVGDGSPLHGRS